MNAEITVSVYSVAMISGGESELEKDTPRITAYLYGHSEIVEGMSTEDRSAVIIRTRSTATYTDTREAIGRLAESALRSAEGYAVSQCDRLGSGLIGARVCGDRNDAIAYALEVL